MIRCNKIYKHPIYTEHTRFIAEKEKTRKFCLHNLEHSLDVARIGYILILERRLNIDKELFYAAALLHDAGRYSGIAHNESGAALARQIMPDCGFSAEETELVANAIANHRINGRTDNFSEVLYEADKKSRLCFTCSAQAECYWENEKRNHSITM